MRDTGPFEKFSNLGKSRSSFKVGLFDFWLLFGAGLVSLLGAYLVVFGFRMASDHTFVFIYFAASALYATLTAAIAATLPRKAGLPVLPIFEGRRARSLTLRKGISPVLAALAVGAIAAYAVLCYDHAIIRLLIGPGSIAINPPSRHPATGPLDIVSTAILEEILFRAVLFPALAIAIERFYGPFIAHGTRTPIWIANVLQALVFGAAHIALGGGMLKVKPWYMRLPLVSQTWGGLMLGYIYWTCGIESAIVCHTAFDLSLELRRIAHVPLV
jgi:membrane protease YdiL (CAAX protease family)